MAPASAAAAQPTPAMTAAAARLQKFELHSSSLTDQDSAISIAIVSTSSSSSTTIPNSVLQAARAQLSQVRARAIERLGVCNTNRANLHERAQIEKKLSEQKAKENEAERQRKKEESERNQRERQERIERDRNEREEREKKEQAEREIDEARSKEDDRRKEDELKRVKDERDRENAVRKAREQKELKEKEQAAAAAKAAETAASDKKAKDVLQIVRDNETQRSKLQESASTTASLTDHDDSVDIKPVIRSDEDDPMADDLPLATTTASLINGSSASQQGAVKIEDQLVPLPNSVPPILVIASDGEEDADIPLPPVRLKGSEHKKRKRDQILDSDASDSDDPAGNQPLLQKIRKLEDMSKQSPSASPSPAPPLATVITLQDEDDATPMDEFEGLTPLQRKMKEEKFIKHSIPTRPPAPGTAQAFYLPSHSLVPPKPVNVPVPPTPKKQSEVCEDFSKAKPGNQISHNAFHTWVDAYLRQFGEDDLAFLAPKPEDISPYLIPALGKHYLDRWEEEDADVPVASTSYVSPLEPPVLPRLRPDALTEDALGMENIFLGPLSERLVAALSFEEGGDLSDPRDKVSRDDEGLPTKLAIMDAVDLEERIKKELRFIGILGEEDVDWSTREDDELSSALRSCQRLLQRQTELNEGRKAILSSIVKDRMAYQEYETTRDAHEKAIELQWTKRQRTNKKKSKKERERKDEGHRQPVSLALIAAVEKRRRLVSQFKPFFEDEEDKGRFYGIPESSIYSELVPLEEELEEEGNAADWGTGALQ
ncbi:hypothetical protein T439DRAFT_353844 [Meredithblackwellia eburnea MCA 4105]